MKNVLVTLVFAAAATVASAQLVNPTFETGDFTGWTTSGDGAFVFTGDEAAITAIPGGVDGGYYAALLPNSSIIQRAGIHLRAGQTVSAWFNAAEIGAGSLDVFMSNGPSYSVPWTQYIPPGSIYPDKWNPISFKIPQDGIYSIGASNPGQFQPFPFLGVDLFTITPVPEVSTYGFLGALLAVAAIVRQRCRASIAAACGSAHLPVRMRPSDIV